MTRTVQDRLPFTVVEDDWRLDDRTRRAGRKGLADARAALAAAARRAERRRHDGEHHQAA